MKKKIIIICSIILVIILLFICNYLYNNKSNGKMLCTNIINGNTHMETNYYVTFSDHFVDKVYSKEVIIPTDTTLLENYYEMLMTMYNNYTDLDYYTNKITVTKKKLVSETTINYKKLDVDKFISIDKNNKKLFTNGKIKLNTLRKQYEKTGAVCKIR